MQNMHKSMYLHILHIYALPTLLMQWYDLLLETRETLVRTLPWESSSHVTTQSTQRLRSLRRCQPSPPRSRSGLAQMDKGRLQRPSSSRSAQF